MTDSSKPPSGRRMKARAPPLPPAPQPAPRSIFRNTVPDGGGTSGLDTKENLLRPTVHLQLTLPQGFQTNVTEDGSKALMDLLVELCSRYHLNPSLHTLELLSPEGHSLGFKPNALLGSLDVACVLIKEKVWEEKVVRRPAPKVPEKTVRLMVNYHSSQKAVVRVNPLVPLQALIEVICDKCDFEPAHVLLLKDSISRHELPLDKSLMDLGIKELYVHDQSLVLQLKMASAPALNYSDSIRASTNSLGRAEKKGILGIFQFSRRKTKTETPMDTDGLDDKVVHSTDTQSNGLSTVSVVSSIEERPNTLGQSQSVMDIPRMSPKAETKKRRAPALPGGLGLAMRQTSFEGYQMGLGSESQQRKRKAPAPPPTPASITPDDTSTSASATSDSQEEEIPTITFRTNVAQSTTVAATTVVTQTVKSEPPPPVCTTTPTPTPSSPSPSSSSTTDSMPLQDSSSELSHSLEDSDLDLDQTSSHYSNVTSSTASGSVRVQPAAKSSSTRVEEQEKASTVAAKAQQERTSASSSMSETESALNLRLDEVENNRQSAIEASDRPAPPKPRRSSTKEAPQPVLPPTPSSPPHEPTQRHSPQSSMEAEEAAPQSWLHSARSSTAGGQKAKAETLEEETVSLGSSSGGGSLPDQGYAASEGMAEGEVSSPSDTQPTSPDGSLSLDGCGGRERLLGPVRDNSSDSDEGCATWGSRHRHDDISPQTKSGRLKDSYQDDPELTAQLHQTLADFEAGLADHIHIVSAKETAYTMSTDSNEVPVSVVDMDVPVTAIDEVLEDYECNTVDNEGKSLTRTESAGSKGPGLCLKSSLEPQNKNNNACTTAEGNKRSSANTQQPHSKPLESKSSVDKQEEKILKGKMKETNITHTKRVKEDKQRTTSTVKSNGDVQRPGKSAEINPEPVKSNAQSLEGKKPVIPPSIQRSTSTERDEEMHRVNQNNSNTSLGKITHTSTSRFGLKTFTVVPQKPPVVRNATEVPAVTLSVGAIKIDDQGNMVKEGTISRNKFGGSSEAGMNCSEESPPLLGKAKAFWSSNERQERDVPHNKGVIDKAKESTDGLKSTPTAISETTLIKTRTTEDLKTAQTSLNNKPSERAQLKEMVREESKEPVIYVQVAEKEHGEEESKISALPPPILPKKDLSFLKPSRRTSSQYVASAINKYAPKPSVKPNSIPNKPDSSASSKTHTYGLQRSGRSIQVNPQQSSVSDHKDIQSNVPGPKRSMSFPEYVSDGRRGFGEVRPERGGFGSCVASSNAPETETTKSRHVQSSGSTPTNMAARNDRDHIKDIPPRSPSPAQNRPVRSFAKPPTAPKTVSLGQASNTRDMTNTATHLTPDAKAKAAVAVADSGVSPGPPLVTVFGTVQKFRPVICKSVEKETSLHGNLMEAIQTGGARDRLKKISTSGPSSMKKASYVDEENERDALLAAIRAKSSSGRLKKTKSEAADELERFRKTSEGEKAAGPVPSPSPSPPSSTRTSPPVFAPPPPAPPPPLLLPQVKPSTVAHPSANAPENPGLTREAMLEAIRSGSAADRLKKVAAPTKTLKVNGRLGTIQPTSSTLPHP